MQPDRRNMNTHDDSEDHGKATAGLHAFACRLLRREGARLTWGARDGAGAARKPDDACGENDGEERYGYCQTKSDTFDEVAVGNCKDRLLRSRVEMFDRP